MFNNDFFFLNINIMEEIIDLLKTACAEISTMMRNTDPLSLSKLTNINNKSGDSVKSLDIISNTILKNHLSKSKYVKIIGSEEDDELYYPENQYDLRKKYMVCFDPLDGSSNIDSNITVGTIFAIYNLSESDNNTPLSDILKNGNSIVCAGYCLYGSSTQFILATNRVQIFLLKNQQFKLIHNNLKIKEKGNIYSINESNKHKWIGDKNQQFIEKLLDEKYTARWVGSMVTDCHRTLIKGGLFAYPENKKDTDGKIRLLYEAYPFAYIFKIAGGDSYNGKKNILDIEFPKNIHQKTPIYLGGMYEINLFKSI